MNLLFKSCYRHWEIKNHMICNGMRIKMWMNVRWWVVQCRREEAMWKWLVDILMFHIQSDTKAVAVIHFSKLLETNVNSQQINSITKPCWHQLPLKTLLIYSKYIPLHFNIFLRVLAFVCVHMCIPADWTQVIST